MSFYELMEPTVIEHQVFSGPCYASLVGDELTLGNDLIEQRWRITGGMLMPAGMRMKTPAGSWTALRQPDAPNPSLLLPDRMGDVQFSTSGGPYYAEDPATLKIELRLPFAHDEIAANTVPLVVLVYRFQIVPGSDSISAELETFNL